MRLLKCFAYESTTTASKITVGVVLFTIMLRLLYSGFICLLPEEAYYWQYAQHLDIGYLDHPPMVAWTIFLGTILFGTNEFGVRFFGLLWWIVSALFVYRLSYEIFDKKTAFASLVLFTVLPFFFLTGFYVTPDSPLTALWAASLFYLYKALIREDESAWWGVGMCVGLGLLSKYTIALLGPATFVFMLLNPKNRKLFLRWRPYISALAALLIFSPVLIWNSENNWISFTFQSADRLKKPMEFSLHLFVLHVIAILTPVGVYVFVERLKNLWDKNKQGPVILEKEKNLFIWVYTLIPLLVIAFFSLTHEVKINWAAPLFLSFMPLIGSSLIEGLISGRRVLEAGWQWTCVMLLLAYLLLFQYLSFGIPGLGFPSNMHKFLTGPDIAAQILQLERQIQRTSGQAPVVVGMDKHYIASQLGFYRKKLAANEQVLENTAGRNLFEKDSLMYKFWTKAEEYEGRDMILISRYPDDLKQSFVRPYFRTVGHMQDLKNHKKGYVVGRFYYTVASGYR
ncbi:MAG: glycosyltransferase family 39 protein, partial [SAR324 cluster bacterium]|nr:glycosyltransferase family 39 protein [SAR324 cluster bacterium]